MVVCVGGSVGVLMSLYGGPWVWGWVCWVCVCGGGCVFGGVGGWGSEFWKKNTPQLVDTKSRSTLCILSSNLMLISYLTTGTWIHVLLCAWQAHIQIPSDWLHRSHLYTVQLWLLHIGVPLRILSSYCMRGCSCHTSCGVKISGVLQPVLATVVLHFMRPT